MFSPRNCRIGDASRATSPFEANVPALILTVSKCIGACAAHRAGAPDRPAHVYRGVSVGAATLETQGLRRQRWPRETFTRRSTRTPASG